MVSRSRRPLKGGNHASIRHFLEALLKKRYAILLAALIIAILGLLAWLSLPIEAYPELADPQVRIITLYPGKGAEEVERLVTVPLEKELNGLPNQKALRSISLYGLSVITSVFKDGTPTLTARNQVLERIGQADIPADAKPDLEPDVGSLREIYRYTLESPYYNAMSLRAIQEWDMEKAFRQIPGVIGVVSQGGPTKTYQVNVDAASLKAYNVTLKQVFEALANSNATTGGNFIEQNDQSYIVRGLGLLNNEKDIRSVVVATSEADVPVRVGDVANVEVGPKVRRGQVGLGDKDDVVEGIVLLRRGENPSEVLETLYKRLPEIRAKLPPGVKLVPLYDRSELIQKTLTTVGENIATGILLVVVILGFFFLDIRFALITAAVIPLSVLVAFIVLKALNIPANLLSLGAIDFGILVDGAVMMTEHIVLKLADEGLTASPRKRLALLIKAAGEMGRPVIFGILTIVITFMPIFTFGGVEGKLFRPLAITMVAALIGAGALSLTLIPVLCSLFLTRKPIIERRNPVVEFLRKHYSRGLEWCLRHSGLLVASAVGILVLTGFLFANLGSEFLPHLEEGNIWLRATSMPGSVSLEDSVVVAHQVRRILGTYPEVRKVLSQEGGPDDGSDQQRFADHEYLVDLQPSKLWRPQFHRDKEQLIAAMDRDLSQIPNVEYYFTQYIQTTLDESLSGVQGSLVAKIAGPDLAVLEGLAKRVGPAMKGTAGIVDVIVDPLLGQPQLTISIDRDKAARYGLNVADLTDLVGTAIGGKTATEVVEGERRFDLVLRLQAPYRANEDALANILVDTPGGGKIPLSEFATLKEVVGATQIWREGGARLATIRANVRGRDLATAVQDAQQRVARSVQLPEGYRIEWSGEFQRQQEASRQLSIVLPITLLVILLILFLTFRSLRSAFIVFGVVPMAALGGVTALWLTHIPFSIAAGVGFIALFGVAIQNGIFLISYIQELREQGQDLSSAVHEGALKLMRPILMTGTVAMIGLLPAATSIEIGSQTQKPFAVVIIGGLISATLLSLFALPAFYYAFAKKLPTQSEGF
jgi:cobalt-zinc-cadmium resistance protein CzcA